MSSKAGATKVSEIDAHVTKQYDILRRLGKGAYGIVWKAIDKTNGKTVAVKKIFDAFRNQTDAQRTFREIMFLLSFANHENVIRLIGLLKANNDRDIYLVFEFMETDLHNVIKRGNILKEIHKVFITYQLLKAIKYIHSGNVIHRDLKPSNILLNAQCHCKIADFGLARSVSQIGEGDGANGSDPTLTDYVATRWYRAPEILIASKRYTKGIDMWSLGCILGEMLLGKALFPGSSTINQVERIMSTLPPPSREDLAAICAEYGTNLLDKAPNCPRRTLREMLPEVGCDALNLLENLMIFNPNNRLTAAQALEHPYVATFHSKGNEPEMSSNVVPLLRDDVQLSVDEYRNYVYSMMEENTKTKSKITSNNKLRMRLSEQLRKQETNGIGQGDGIVKSSFHYSCDDLRKERKYKPIPDFNKTVPLNSDNISRRMLPNRRSIGTNYLSSSDKSTKSQARMDETANNGRKPTTVCGGYNSMSEHYKNLPPGQAKSCVHLSHQEPHVRSNKLTTQRSLQSEQVISCHAVKAVNPEIMGKAKRALTKQSSPVNVVSSGNLTRKVCRTSTPECARKHMISSSESSASSSNSSALKAARQNASYVKQQQQSIPILKKRIQQGRITVDPYQKKFDGKEANSLTDNGPSKYQKQQQANRFAAAAAAVATRNEIKPQIGRCGYTHQANQLPLRNVKGQRLLLNSYNHNHGVITASAYKELCNGTIGW